MVDHAEYLKLCSEVWHHNKKYFVDHAPEITDEQFDHLVKDVEQIEKLHPEWITPASPTQRVGEMLSHGFKTVSHSIPMLSLANTYSKEELESFIQRVHKLLGKKDIPFCSELKMDGIAISLRYENGVFVRGVTRGDGKQGEDITANLRTISALPLQLLGESLPSVLEVRGEVFMLHKTFDDLNKQRVEAGEEEWANPRNAAAGSLKLLDSREVVKRKLQVVAYAVAEDSSHGVSSQHASHAYMKEMGLPTLKEVAHCTSLEEVWAFAEQIREKRDALPFDIDGIVTKVDELRLHKQLGNTDKSPRWAIAYKFAAKQTLTRIREITVQVGRTGTLTPVAELEPVFLAGSTISRATLHNEEEVKRKDVRVGDVVAIEKGGDVIPKVVNVVLEQRGPHTHPWSMPLTCPSCGASVVREEDLVAVRCPNAEKCPEQQLRRIAFFVSKGCMDIDGMGEKVVAQLVEKEFVKSPSDIYRLTSDQLSQLEGFKEKSVNNLLKSIKASQDVPLARFIMALGIKYVGAGTADTLARKAGDIQTLMKMSKETLLNVEGIGEKVATALVDFFANGHNKTEVEILLQLGITPRTIEVKDFSGHPFSGKTFVLTGTLQTYTRDAAASLIKERGGKVTNSVSKNTDFLLAGEAAGSKLDKAKQLHVQILSEEDFSRALLQEAPTKG